MYMLWSEYTKVFNVVKLRATSLRKEENLLNTFLFFFQKEEGKEALKYIVSWFST